MCMDKCLATETWRNLGQISVEWGGDLNVYLLGDVLQAFDHMLILEAPWRRGTRIQRLLLHWKQKRTNALEL